MEEKTLPKLLMSREETEQKIQERIDKGQRLGTRQIDSEDKLENAVMECKEWSKYNEALLSKLFDRISPANEYCAFSDWGITNFSTGLGYRSTEPAFSVKLNNYQKSLNSSIDSLEGILDRLELFDESSVNHSFAFGDEVFIVHGRDDGPKETVAGFLRKLGLKATILHEQPSEGLTIIEKLEKYANNAGFAIVLFTPDDVGALKNEIEDKGKPRARQNVVFELGYFIGKLGRKRVCPLFKGEIEKPSDIDGVIYVPMNGEDWKLKLCQEMKNADFPVDMNKIL